MDVLLWQMIRKTNNGFKSVDNYLFILCALGYRNQIIMFIGIKKMLHNEDGKWEWLHTIMCACLPEVERKRVRISSLDNSVLMVINI